MDEKELSYRQKLIDQIEAHCGCYEAVWNQWPTNQIEKVYDRLLDYYASTHDD